MNAKQLFEHLIAKNNISFDEMKEVIHACMTGAFSDIQIAAFLILMRVKGETVEELTAAATVMQELAHTLNLGSDLIDIVGTGGDGKNTFNISTACCFVVAGAGIRIAKHGNRSVSSRSGSADVLEHAGFNLTGSDKQIQECIDKSNLAFLFAPQYHPAMQHARTARQQLGIRTLFNILGPLINPAQAKKQVVGVFSTSWIKPLAEVLANLGSERALVLSSQDGLDEISIVAPTDVMEYKNKTYSPWVIIPKEYGIHHTSLDSLIVNNPGDSLRLIEEVLNGVKGPARDIVLLNSAAAIYCAHDENDFVSALDIAKSSIDTGQAMRCFNELRLLTQRQNQPT